MSRRGRGFFGAQFIDVDCVAPGCRDTESMQFWGDTRKERLDSIARGRAELEARGGALCIRHRNPEQVPGPERRMVEQTLVVVRRDRGLVAVPIDDLNGSGTGFATGPGFRFYADEFEPGTRVTFTVTVQTPADLEAAFAGAES